MDWLLEPLLLLPLHERVNEEVGTAVNYAEQNGNILYGNWNHLMIPIQSKMQELYWQGQNMEYTNCDHYSSVEPCWRLWICSFLHSDEQSNWKGP